MPIAPIVGKLRKRFIFDLSLSLGLGTAAAYGYHLKAIERQEQFYLKLEREKLSQK
ncbi:hypothetical protein GYMLUDRAFT_243482 [Collybiopsis luxurians FD-317 M1]|uniref:Cytochrome c oxidase polypeptide VIIA n=1 Tax=Collybiopsis luxurians FD-317 M1 TaxID=944289 RepID=A0A0D0BDL5_9AGAR|nr:hypothetical protein GYMLUDRAFT_243482 [Collybiopsis luxurians FD-317 M1]